MFAFFVVMLILAALTDNAEVMISESNVVGYADAENLLTSDELESNNKTK